MFLTGFADEAGNDFSVQIKATKELGWKFIETRRIGDKTLAALGVGITAIHKAVNKSILNTVVSRNLTQLIEMLD